MRAAGIILLACLLAPRAASAYGDRFDTALDAGGAGSGGAVRAVRSPYLGDGVRYDYLPVNVYAGEHAYLHSDRVGLKLDLDADQRVDMFLAHRYEGTPLLRPPAALAGMALREQGTDLGIGYRRRTAWGSLGVELLHNVDDASRGSEARLRLAKALRRGELRLWPQATLSWRDTKLNDYYYGVRPAEAAAARPAYLAGSGLNLELALYAAYPLSKNWQLLGGISATQWSGGVRTSPIVENRLQATATLGLLYEHSPQADAWSASRPLWVKVYTGKASECDVLQIVRLACTSTRTPEDTRVASIELGRTLIERLNGWNIDIAGYIGLLRHDENGYQPDHWQVNAYVKSFWYGFPWRDRVKTRIGIGSGLSYAERVPTIEARDQARRGENTNKLITYLDPTIDFSLGDLVGSRALKNTFVGLGVSHRSGVFGLSQLLGNVDGGSNYIYTYVEFGI
ncbi:MAG: MipA/OmpV family protein [Betaproteobacteria bacterium]|nr:MipA/OmpV family protein [Betaproteobacteria bacterium]